MSRRFYDMDTPGQSALSLVLDHHESEEKSISPMPDYEDDEKSIPATSTSQWKATQWKGFQQPGPHLSRSNLAAYSSLQLPDSPQTPGFPPTAYRPILPESPQTATFPPTAPSKVHPGPPAPPGGPPPDGGLTAWLQVVSGYFLFFNTWGLINAFGVFQTYYSNVLLDDMSNSQVSWIGTFTAFLLCASPISWGPVFDIGSPRLLVIFGSLCVVFGLMMTSICTEYWQILLAQGVVCGVGGGCLFITATSILPSYFAKKRALAMGLAASGSSLGGIVYPIVFHLARPLVGFPWTVRIIGFIALLTLVVPCAFIQPRAKPPGKRKVFDLNIIKELPFEVFNLATFFGFVGQYIPYFYIVDYTLEHDMSVTFYMLIVLNVGSIPGRIIPSVLADKYFPPIMVLAVCTSCATALAFCWIAIKHSTTGLVVWSLLYGFCSGAFVSLQGAVVASMTTDMRTIGTRFGINMFAGALGILIGSPVGGAIFPHSWPGAQTFCAVMLLASTASIVATWFVYKWDKARRSRRPKG